MSDARWQWQCVPFEQLSSHTLYQVLALRSSVFVVEQQCPYQDVDGKDPLAWHLLGYCDGELAAYSRILMPGEAFADAASIGRVTTSAAHRGSGIGGVLINKAVAECRKRFPQHPIRIEAQKYLTRFYERAGFQVEGDAFLLDGIVHIPMVAKPEPLSVA